MGFFSESSLYAQRLPRNLPILFFDDTNPIALAATLAKAVSYRREGTLFYVAPFLRDAAEVHTRKYAIELLKRYDDVEERELYFDHLAQKTLTINNISIKDLRFYEKELIGTMREIAQMADAVVFRSQTERSYVENMLNCRKSYVIIAPFADPSIANVISDPNAKGIMIWAPNEDAQALAIFAYALWDCQRAVTFVCRGMITNTPHRFVDPSNAEPELKNAAVIVDANFSDPGTALSFADRGFGIVAARSTGAHEYLQGAMTYDSTSYREIRSAVHESVFMRKVYSSYPVINTAQFSRFLAMTVPPKRESNPLVSIVVSTYNRRNELRRGLEAFKKQKYPNLEVVVVNDCGESVADLVSEFPFARYLETPINGGCSKAINLGLRACLGEFVGVIADDDLDYPFHVWNLAEALTASGLEVAYGNIVLRLDHVEKDGSMMTRGHLLVHDNDHDSTAVEWGGACTHLQGYLVRREAFESIGFLDESLVATNDCSTILALSSRYDFAHIDAVTGEMAYRDDKSNLSSRLGQGLVAELGSVYQKYAPPRSQLTASRQKFSLAMVAGAQTTQTFFNPRIELSPFIPLPGIID